jgi:hypothetical protein
MRSGVDDGDGQRLKWFCMPLLAALFLIATACGDDSPSRNPVAPDAGIDAAALAGSWSGTIATLQGTGTLRLQLVGPEAERYTGTWSAVFSDTLLNRQGTLSASVRWATFGVPRLPFLDVDLTAVTRSPCDSVFGERMYVFSLGVIAANRMVGDGEFGGCGSQINLARVQLSR